MDRKELYAERVEAQLQEWDAEIQKLKAKAWYVLEAPRR